MKSLAPFLLCFLTIGCSSRHVSDVAIISNGQPQVAVSAEAAKEIAMAAMHSPTNHAPFVQVIPDFNGATNVWVVQLAHPIAGAWRVEVDKATGVVVSREMLPSR